MNNITTRTQWGPMTLTVNDHGVGIIDETAVEAFTCGQCHALALAIHAITKWPMVGLGSEYDRESPAHVVCQIPGTEHYVDIAGFHEDLRSFPINQQQVVMSEIPVLKARKMPYYIKPDLKAAKPFAVAVLMKYGPQLLHLESEDCHVSAA